MPVVFTSYKVDETTGVEKWTTHTLVPVLDETTGEPIVRLATIGDTTYVAILTGDVGSGVSSVNGLTGVVTLTAASVGADSAGAAAAEGVTRAAADAALSGRVTALEDHDEVPMALWVNRKPAASEVMVSLSAPFAFTLPANLAGSRFRPASVAATGVTVFAIMLNGLQVGSVSYAASGSTPSASTSAGAAVSVLAGDVLEFIAPATQDATLEKFGWTIVGVR